jgi:putative hemin transport protein
MNTTAAEHTQTAAATAAALRERYLELKRASRPYARDAALQLGVSEAEIVACMVGDTAVRLTPSFPALMGKIESLGRVMALTRNEHAVHEKDGVYLNMQHHDPIGMALGDEIDLRIFYRHWTHGFAVSEATHEGSAGGDAHETRGEIRHSLQFFDAHGVAVHKIHLRPHSNVEAFKTLVAEFAAADQSTGLAVEAPPAREIVRGDQEIDVAGLREAWRGMQDTHEFFGLLKKFDVQRHQALRLAGAELAYPVAIDSARVLLNFAAAEATPIMVFVGNRGMIQIHGGPVRTIRQSGPWLNVLDSDFNLHLREDRIATAWVVRKPTADGFVTSLELFDDGQENIAMFFGRRRPGKPELAAWRKAIAQLTPLVPGTP